MTGGVASPDFDDPDGGDRRFSTRVAGSVGENVSAGSVHIDRS